jgi:hypothetical protein
MAGAFSVHGSDEQIFGPNEQVLGRGSKRPRDMSHYDEYQIVINEAQRRLIMRALTNAMANDRRSTADGALTRPTEDEWMQLIRLFSTIKPSMRKRLP